MTFDQEALTLVVVDNGVGMSRQDVSDLFAKVGASAAAIDSNKDSVGEFGIGVVSYFMAADTFELQTYDGVTDPIGLVFTREMLAGRSAAEVRPTRAIQGTEIVLRIRNAETFDLLLQSFPHWCRDVEGLTGQLLPAGKMLDQGDSQRAGNTVALELPNWIERSHLGPVADPIGWDAMTGVSKVAVLYRGVFVQEFEVKGIWGIQGSIDVDPKHFKPRLNREGFVQGQFESEVQAFLQICHPVILGAMAERLAKAVAAGQLNRWTQKRWASLWLSVPRSAPYAATASAWDQVFRSLPAFEAAVGNRWDAISLEHLKSLGEVVFVAPLPDEQTNDVVMAAVRLLRNTRQPVIRGIRRDKAWMRYAPASYGTTADLISHVFANELPNLTLIRDNAEQIVSGLQRAALLFTGPPTVDLVRLGVDSPPALRLRGRLVLNIDHPSGSAIVRDVLEENRGPVSLIAIAARHAYEQLGQVAAVVKEIAAVPEILSPIRRRFIRSQLT